jgi:hypothetical protein
MSFGQPILPMDVCLPATRKVDMISKGSVTTDIMITWPCAPSHGDSLSDGDIMSTAASRKMFRHPVNVYYSCRSFVTIATNTETILHFTLPHSSH